MLGKIQHLLTEFYTKSDKKLFEPIPVPTTGALGLGFVAETLDQYLPSVSAVKGYGSLSKSVTFAQEDSTIEFQPSDQEAASSDATWVDFEKGLARDGKLIKFYQTLNQHAASMGFSIEEHADPNVTCHISGAPLVTSFSNSRNMYIYLSHFKGRPTFWVQRGFDLFEKGKLLDRDDYQQQEAIKRQNREGVEAKDIALLAALGIKNIVSPHVMHEPESDKLFKVFYSGELDLSMTAGNFPTPTDLENAYEALRKDDISNLSDDPFNLGSRNPPDYLFNPELPRIIWQQIDFCNRIRKTLRKKVFELQLDRQCGLSEEDSLTLDPQARLKTRISFLSERFCSLRDRLSQSKIAARTEMLKLLANTHDAVRAGQHNLQDYAQGLAVPLEQISEHSQIENELVNIACVIAYSLDLEEEALLQYLDLGLLNESGIVMAEAATAADSTSAARTERNLMLRKLDQLFANVSDIEQFKIARALRHTIYEKSKSTPTRISKIHFDKDKAVALSITFNKTVFGKPAAAEFASSYSADADIENDENVELTGSTVTLREKALVSFLGDVRDNYFEIMQASPETALMFGSDADPDLANFSLFTSNLPERYLRPL